MLPTTSPTAISECLIITARIQFANSGREVPAATTTTPMVNKEIEKKIFLSYFSKIHFIFLPSNTTVKYFVKKIKLFLANKKSKAPKIINTGYLKLDHVRRKLRLINNKKDSILIAPTGSHMLKNFNISIWKGWVY